MSNMGIAVKKFDQYKAGDTSYHTKTATEADVVLFAGITGDYNPLHINGLYAAETRFRKRVVHGVFTVGLVSAAVTLLGTGGAYVSQDCKFIAPVYIGDTITARVEVIDKIPEKKMLVLKTTAFNQNGKDVLVGQAKTIVLEELEAIYP